MYKSSAKHLQGLELEKSHSAHGRTLVDSYNESNASFLAGLKTGKLLSAVVCSCSTNELAVSFRSGCFKGTASIEEKVILKVGDAILVKLYEKAIGTDGRILLKTQYVKKLQGNNYGVTCKRCKKKFDSIDQLSEHVEYTCNVSFCRHCGASYGSKSEIHHLSKACLGKPSAKKKKR